MHGQTPTNQCCRETRTKKPNQRLVKANEWLAEHVKEAVQLPEAEVMKKKRSPSKKKDNLKDTPVNCAAGLPENGHLFNSAVVLPKNTSEADRSSTTTVPPSNEDLEMQKCSKESGPSTRLTTPRAHVSRPFMQGTVAQQLDTVTFRESSPSNYSASCASESPISSLQFRSVGTAAFGPSAAAEGDPWLCTSCSFINSTSADECDACGVPRFDAPNLLQIIDNPQATRSVRLVEL